MNSTQLYFGGQLRPHTTRIVFLLLLLLLLGACTSSTLAVEENGSEPEENAETSVDDEVATEEVSPEGVDPETNGETNETAIDEAATNGPLYPPTPLDDITADLDGSLLGISTGLSRAERAPRFRSLEEQAGRQFDIGHVFHSWDSAIPSEDDLMHLEDGRILMISWNGTDTKEIQEGIHDEWIRLQATAVRDLEETIMLRWLWEMDGNRRRDWVHSGEDYVAAWNHVRSIFDEVGADNAQFVWCPNEFLFWDGGDPEPWYPGDENVDWLCADGYNWETSVDAPEWISFDRIFEDFYAWAAPRDLPIVIAETGSNEAIGNPQGKADWLRSIPGILENDLPEIDAVVYFDKDFTFLEQPNWLLDTTPESLEAWNDIANDPYFNPLG